MKGEEVGSVNQAGLPWSGKKVWKMIFFQVRGKSENFDVNQGNLEKMGKVRDFQNFPLNGMAKTVF